MSVFQRLEAAWARSDDLLGRLPDLQARPIALRHPFLFYLGHLPAFARNQVVVGHLGRGEPSNWDQLFAFGIDPDSVEEAPERAVWPPERQVWDYVERCRQELRAVFGETESAGGLMGERHRIWQMVIEHELMHHETLMYMVQRGGLSLSSEEVIGGPGEAARPVAVEGGGVTLGADQNTLDFGWDNEFPRHEVAVESFEIDSLPVRNVDWLAFMKAGGPRPHHWTERGLMTVCGEQPFEVVEGWPVQVSQEQASAYAEWKGRRLPTEAELARVRHRTPADNVGFQRWSPVPVGRAGQTPSGVREVVGNGWEWTQTLFGPLPGFEPYIQSYPGYSQDFFDGKHVVVVGGSWATDPALLRPSFRNWYRRDYPYVFSKFRTVRR